MATLEERLQNLTQEVNPMSSGVMSDQDVERMASPEMNTTMMNKMLLSGMQDEAMPMSDVDTSVFQPLVDLGFEQEVRTILTNPMNSTPSVEAQQKIIQELGTGMDVDGFLMEVQKVAPQDVDVAMSNIEAGGDTTRMMTPVSMQASDVDMQGIMSMMGRMEDTTMGHLAEGDVVVPPEVLQANPPIADALDETMMQMGVDPRSRIVDTTGELGGIASINPDTGLQEFFLKKALSKLNRARKKVTKKLAPVVGAVAPLYPVLDRLLKQV